MAPVGVWTTCSCWHILYTMLWLITPLPGHGLVQGFFWLPALLGAHHKVYCKCIDATFTFTSSANSPSGHRMMDFPFRFSVFSGTSPMFLMWGKSHFLQGGVWIACRMRPSLLWYLGKKTATAQLTLVLKWASFWWRERVLSLAVALCWLLNQWLSLRSMKIQWLVKEMLLFQKYWTDFPWIFDREYEVDELDNSWGPDFE